MLRREIKPEGFVGRMPLEGVETLKRLELERGKLWQVAHVPECAVGARTSGGGLRSFAYAGASDKPNTLEGNRSLRARHQDS